MKTWIEEIYNIHDSRHEGVTERCTCDYCLKLDAKYSALPRNARTVIIFGIKTIGVYFVWIITGWILVIIMSIFSIIYAEDKLRMLPFSIVALILSPVIGTLMSLVMVCFEIKQWKYKEILRYIR